MKKVSIVIPAFNQADYLPACVDHCVYQTYPYLEIIIVDGGSGDGTKTYLAGLKKEINNRTCRPVTEMDSAGNLIRREFQAYPQNRELKIVTFDTDIGPTRTYNEGLGRVTGAYCTYVVGDDLPHPHMIEALVTCLEATGADFVYSDMDVVDDGGRIVRQIRLPDYQFEACLAKWYFLGVSHLYRTTWHQRVGLMDEDYQSANDYDHYLRFAMAGAKFYHLPRILYSVRLHGPDRNGGQHTPQRDRNLIAESQKCAYRARKWLSTCDPAK